MFYQANEFVKAPNLMVLLMIKSVIVTITIIFGSNVSTVVINFTVFNPQNNALSLSYRLTQDVSTVQITPISTPVFGRMKST